MKFCPHCKRWNTGDPQRCHFCARTWNVKLCSAGHVNPPNAMSCGECGRTHLSEPAGRTPFPFNMIRFIKPVVRGCLVLFGIIILASLFEAGSRSGADTIIVPMFLMLAVLYWCIRIIGPNFRGMLTKLFKRIFDPKL